MMNNNSKKNDSSTKSSSLYDTFLSIQYGISKLITRRCLRISFVILSVGLIFCTYYAYLQQRYLIDEVYDVVGPNEYTLKDQFTIRVYAPQNFGTLENFVLKHSICPIVHEIQILWHSSTHDAPPVESFPYSTAHSKVSYHYFKDPEKIYETYFDSSTIKTTGKLLPKEH